MAKKKAKPKEDWVDVLQETRLRCAGCGGWVKVPEEYRGKACKKCGTPISVSVQKEQTR